MPRALLLMLALTGCQFASGLSDLHGDAKPKQASGVERACASSADCGSAKPHCLNEYCVDDGVAERWVCEHDNRSKAENVRYAFRVVDFLSRTPPKHVEAKACRSNDVACESPVDTYSDDDQIGYLQFTLPAGFLGYFEIESEFLTTLLYVTKPIVASSENRDVPLVSEEAYEKTAMLAGVDVLPDTGLVLLDAVDCTGTPAGGIEFKAHDVDVRRFYLIDMVPNTKAEVTEYDAINNTADAAFVSVPSGFVTFSAHLGVDGIQLQSFNATVRASSVTFIDMMFE